MAGGDHGGESNDTPEPVIKSFATLNQLQSVILPGLFNHYTVQISRDFY